MRQKVRLSLLITLFFFVLARSKSLPELKSYAPSHGSWKTLVFKDVGSVEYPPSELKIYSILDVYRESEDSVFAEISEDGFLINHVNSVGGGDFFQVVFSISQMDNSDMEIFNYDYSRMSSSELNELRQYFQEFFDASMGSVPEVQSLGETTISPFRGRIKVGYGYDRKPSGLSKLGMVDSYFVMIPLRGKLLTILFEYRKSEVDSYKPIRKEILESLSPF